MLIGETLKG